jgi:serine/threonine protein phosphatase PrpC
MGGFSTVATGISEVGRVREANEDRILILDRAGRGTALYAVADGLGGHAAGNLASEVAVATLGEVVPALVAQRVAPREALVVGLRRANAVIRQRAADSPGRSGMATTCTAVMIGDRDGVVAHVGDSRAYLIRDLEVRQLTTDHSFVAELVRHGSIQPREAGTHAQRHVLTRALGAEDDVQVDVIVTPLRAGDILVLTSDGLHAAVSPEEMTAVIRGTPDFSEACRILTGLANARGGLDNASLVVIRVQPRWVGRVGRAMAPLALAVLLAAGGGVYRLEHSYFLGVRGDRVAVMQGVPARVLGVPLFSVQRLTAVPVAAVAPAYRDRLRRGIPAHNPQDAETLLQDLLHHP